jgi:hypothetical protein
MQRQAKELMSKLKLKSKVTVKCISQKLTKEQSELVSDIFKSSDFHITVDKEYLVYGISFDLFEGNRVCLLQHLTDYGNLVSSPILLFEVVDDRVSKHWIFKVSDSGGINLFPESFYQAFYRDDLFEQVPQVLSDFKRVQDMLEHEFD